MKIITRFAPSPTGKLHIGSIRTALFSWLYAKQHNGKFILRIENSDIKRSKNVYIKHIIKYLKWLNLTWDNIYIQTKRYFRYKEIINYLLLKNLAYKCYCSKRRLQQLKILQLQKKVKPKYDRYCLNKISKKKEYVIRFNNPQSGKISFYDLIHGNIEFNNNELDDLIICRSDGTFTYNFCCVVDDYDMKITHIIRGEEHINNTPRQINLLKAINSFAKIPYFVHLPLILDNNKKKISKRKNNLSNISYYKNQGYLPYSIINYLIRLGWGYKNKELFNISEILKLFDLNKINKSSAIYDINKLNWYNKYYIRNTKDNELVKLFKLFLKEQKLTFLHDINFDKLIILLKNRCNTFKEIYNNYNYLFNHIKLNSNLIKKIYFIINDKKIILNIIIKIKKINVLNKNNIVKNINNISYLYNVKSQVIYCFLQLILTTKVSTPPITDIMVIIGKKNVLKRLYNYFKYLHLL